MANLCPTRPSRACSDCRNPVGSESRVRLPGSLLFLRLLCPRHFCSAPRPRPGRTFQRPAPPAPPAPYSRADRRIEVLTRMPMIRGRVSASAPSPRLGAGALVHGCGSPPRMRLPGWTSQSPAQPAAGSQRFWPTKSAIGQAKKVAGAVAQGSELGFLATNAARDREVDRRVGCGSKNAQAVVMGSREDSPESRAGGPIRARCEGYESGPASGAARSHVIHWSEAKKVRWNTGKIALGRGLPVPVLPLNRRGNGLSRFSSSGPAQLASLMSLACGEYVWEPVLDAGLSAASVGHYTRTGSDGNSGGPAGRRDARASLQNHKRMGRQDRLRSGAQARAGRMSQTCRDT